MLQWLSVDRSPQPRKSHRDSSLSARLSTTPKSPRERKNGEKPQAPAVANKIRKVKDGYERSKTHKRADTAPIMGKPSVDEEQNVRNFTVANVGAGGTLFLKPTRATLPHMGYASATPTATSGGSSVRSSRPLLRASEISGTWTPPPSLRARSTVMAGVSVPPLSLANSRNRPRTRSHSCSTINDRTRAAQYDVNEFQLPSNDKASVRPRRRSSADLHRGLSGIYIPDYRLGTPRFSEQGTAYLHYSMHAHSSSGVPSSVISRAEFDKLFPMPPGGDSRAFYSRMSSGLPFLHPSSAYNINATSRAPFASMMPWVVGNTTPAIFESVESNLDSPELVKYHPTTGRIVAATPARLIAQITSPRFLDYELLADFFLTFRCFMQPTDLLQYLFARMRWAFDSGDDCGRIARVRTFVALRHWILNYFTDDFVTDLPFRRAFCKCVNELAWSLRQRPDRGGSDMNIIGELKKCWRRTSALHWHIPDAHESSPDMDISPGGEPETQPGIAASALSLPLTIRPTTRSHSIFEMTQIRLPDGGTQNNTLPQRQGSTAATNRTASIPASPASEQSLEVLSCSLPFLRHIRPTARAREKPISRSLQTQGKTGKPTSKSNHGHKRSGSFSDALRDRRTPLSSQKADNIELKDLPNFSITGGLVRGILLQPSSSGVEKNIPVTPDPPGPELTEARLVANENQQPNSGVKKFVGEVRRALSNRKGSSGSPSRSVGSTSSGSESRGPRQRIRRKPPPEWQPGPGPARFDILGLRIEDSYQDATEKAKQMRQEPLLESRRSPPSNDAEAALGEPSELDSKPEMIPADKDLPVTSSLGTSPTATHDSTTLINSERMHSHVTTGSRSIVIMDATGTREILPTLPSLSSISTDVMPAALFGGRSNLDGEWRPSIESTHDFLTVPSSWNLRDGRIRSNTSSERYGAPRRSSSLVRTSTFGSPPFHHQLRRRPGGDLRAADHVHDLESRLRPRTHRSFSEGAVTPAYHSVAITSAAPSIVVPARHEIGRSGLPRKKSVSLIQATYSQPNLRPSFVFEAERLKGLPDLEPRGGIEDTLLKLEGRHPTPVRSTFFSAETHDSIPDGHSTANSPSLVSGPMMFHPNIAITHSPVSGEDVDSDIQRPGVYHPSESGMSSTSPLTAYTAPYTSPPPLDPSTASSSSTSVVPMGAGVSRHLIDEHEYAMTGASSPGLYPYDRKPESMRDSITNSHYPDTRPDLWAGQPRTSFMMDDNQSLSDISTEIASFHEDGVRSFYFDDTLDDDGPSIGTINPHPSVAASISPLLEQPADRSKIFNLLTREPSRPLKETISQPRLMPQSPNQPFPLRPFKGFKPNNALTESFPAHLPFVLAYGSEVIAEQLTIIEKDALDEIDWKDLVSLNWQQRPPDVRNWVDYLEHENANGIDIVIARFNLVVKWTISEIVLTEAISERARAITKYIHVAAHCNRLRNYASMYQIVLALLSSNIARLSRTWSLVAVREKQMLDYMEQLCRPLRNFHSLRAEMETAMPGNGIIPFIGLYTHDLMYNALKSPRITPPPPGNESLVNFERYQTAAEIVKNLLRLIEASSKYAFNPEPEALSRCLWIAALDDHELAARSRALEPI